MIRNGLVPGIRRLDIDCCVFPTFLTNSKSREPIGSNGNPGASCFEDIQQHPGEQIKLMAIIENLKYQTLYKAFT